MATARQWISAARPRTLPAALSPVAAGTGAAIATDGFQPAVTIPRAALALVLALALQVGVNYANDYSDGIRGTDDDRVGPFRLTGSRSAPASHVKYAAFGCFGLGAVAGIVLVALAQAWWLVLVGAACILAAWFYTGGKHPYGYLGLGEVMVFVFFGLVAVTGTTYTQIGGVPWQAWVCSVCVGLLAVAILVINNLRDIPSDRASGKMTLAVRLGDTGTRVLYTACLVLPLVGAIVLGLAHPWALLALLTGALMVSPIRDVAVRRLEGRHLIPALGATGRSELVYALLLLLGLALG